MPKQTRASGKGGALTGGALIEEALDSSKSVLRPTRLGASRRGLQQFFTPPVAARLIKSVIAPKGEGPATECSAPARRSPTTSYADIGITRITWMPGLCGLGAVISFGGGDLAGVVGIIRPGCVTLRCAESVPRG